MHHSLVRSTTRGVSKTPTVQANSSNEATYEDEVIHRIRETIKDQVSQDSVYTIDEVKHVKHPTPKSYSGKDDIEVFENWLAEILRWFRVTGTTGKGKDQLRIDLCGTTLTDMASTWFH